MKRSRQIVVWLAAGVGLLLGSTAGQPSSSSPATMSTVARIPTPEIPRREIYDIPPEYVHRGPRRAVGDLLAEGRALASLRRRHTVGDMDAFEECNNHRMALEVEIYELFGEGEANRTPLREAVLTCASCDAANADRACDVSDRLLRRP